MENNKLRRLGTMIDCSRNAVMTVESVKKWIDISALMGYNTVLLYTEDTYELNENPYFGYMRGRYTKDEIREIDSHALKQGVELIPCIQTLAHLNAIIRWPRYSELVDTADILLAGDERVYDLIDKMFESIAECYTTKHVNIGMDEAHMVGRGKYYDLHGDVDRSKILIEHIKRVAKIGEKYGFTLSMWSDMFFRLVCGGEYWNNEAKIDEEIRNQIPKNVELIYWDYYVENKEHYDKMFQAHDKVKKGTWFAGGFWTWVGFAPHNNWSMKIADSAMRSCIEHNVKDIFFTMWGDDGAECSKFALIPSMFYVAELAKGNTDMTLIKKRFEELFKISFDDFMLLELPGTPNGQICVCNAEKYLLYNDCFTGLMNSTISGGENYLYQKCAEKIAGGTYSAEWRYLFETAQALCEVLAIKAELSIKTRKAYEKRDKTELKLLIADYKEVLCRIECFYECFKQQWYKENKPHGFDVQEQRLGGLLLRIRSCKNRLQEFCDGKINRIEELEENQLDFFGGREEFIGKHDRYYNSWMNIVTTNIISENP